MADSLADSRATLPDGTGTRTLNVPAGLKIHQITVCNGSVSGSVTVKIKPESSPNFIPLNGFDGVTAKTFTVGAAASDTGDIAITESCSIEAIMFIGSGGTSYCVGYAAFDAQ
jgi:hypothetical protein